MDPWDGSGYRRIQAEEKGAKEPLFWPHREDVWREIGPLCQRSVSISSLTLAFPDTFTLCHSIQFNFSNRNPRSELLNTRSLHQKVLSLHQSHDPLLHQQQPSWLFTQVPQRCSSVQTSPVRLVVTVQCQSDRRGGKRLTFIYIILFFLS